MKKRILCLLLAAALLIAIPVFASADTTGVCFTAVGDTMMDLNSMAVFSAGTLYVPGKAFSSYGVNITIFETACLLNNNSKQVFFDFNAKNAYDSAGNYYDAAAFLRGGQLYVPVAWVCSYFGLSYSYISGNGNGDIVRVKDGNEVLNDTQFLDAATSLMKTRYNEYFGMVSPSTPAPTATPAPTPVEDDDEKKPKDTYIFLTFIGVPEQKLVDSLSRFGYSATFFVTEQQALDSPDMIRQLYGSGHNIGVYCQSSADECESTANAIFSVCQSYPTLVSSPAAICEACVQYCSDHAMAYLQPDISADADTGSRNGIASRLESANGYVSISVALSDTTARMLPSLFSGISSEGYSVLPLRETFI